MSKKTRKKSPKTAAAKAAAKPAKSGQNIRQGACRENRQSRQKASNATAKKTGKATSKKNATAPAKASHKAPSKPLREPSPPESTGCSCAEGQVTTHLPSSRLQPRLCRQEPPPRLGVRPASARALRRPSTCPVTAAARYRSPTSRAGTGAVFLPARGHPRLHQGGYRLHPAVGRVRRKPNRRGGRIGRSPERPGSVSRQVRARRSAGLGRSSTRCWKPMASGAKNRCMAGPSSAFFAQRFWSASMAGSSKYGAM